MRSAPEVRVNAVAPGAVDSAWQIQWTEARRRESAEKAALKRRCTPDDLAEVIVFLGFGAAMVTGQTVVVDGGLTRERLTGHWTGTRLSMNMCPVSDSRAA